MGAVDHIKNSLEMIGYHDHTFEELAEMGASLVYESVDDYHPALSVRITLTCDDEVLCSKVAPIMLDIPLKGFVGWRFW